MMNYVVRGAGGPGLCAGLGHSEGTNLVNARPLEVRKLDNTAHKTMAMLHSGPSHGGKGHKSQTQHAPIPRQLKQSVPSNP
ncbi:hypothetical protein VIGAN_08044700 [Vigna angularis var. angularis]|uniref:Uncharacterized protein n=1 Tax=Vigna angularis var. angularis TaxID=157739 RepID=A0A0S3SM37_PHAAN|nr:hypothetical protein VIGAN_08044700 [Vigna angularis var. angularis]